MQNTSLQDPRYSHLSEADMAKVHKVEILISNILRFGVITSLIVVIAGTVVSFTHHHDYFYSKADLAHLESNKAGFPHTPGAVYSELLQGRGLAIVIVGLLLLIATPVVRVAVSIFAFVYQRDRVFVAITTLVLLLLLLSFFLGKASG